mgnify:FL=1
MDYKFKKGITDTQIDQLIHYSKTDPQVIRFTSDPVRFKNKKKATKWFSDVTPYTLSDSSGNLIGLSWFHEKRLPERAYLENLNFSDFSLTFAIRVYGEARGKGLSYDFMKKSFSYYMDSRFRGNDKAGVWVEISFDNIPTIKLAEKFGFTIVSEPDERGKIIMIRSPL